MDTVNRMLCRTLFQVLVAVFITNVAVAVPAKPGLVEYRCPDGSMIPIYIRGDEHNHFYVSTDGYPILMGDDGFLYYATLSGEMATASAMRAVGESQRDEATRQWLAAQDTQLVWEGMKQRGKQARKQRAAAPPMRATTFPTIGEHKALVVLVEYSDVAFTLSDPQDYFSRMLNETGFSDNGGTGSARDYYIQSSDSLYLPDFDVYGPVTLSHAMSYYGGNDWWGNDQHPEQMVVEACEALDDEIDFTQYDADGDGVVDNVYVFYAGYGEASGGSSSTVWPHSWSLSSAGTSLTLDGVRINHYACSNEIEGGGFYDGIGTFCHEYGHVLGLPDLYATSYTSAFTPGAYSLMDYGSYNNDSRTPPTLSAYERYELNWIVPITIQPTDTVVQLPHIMDTNVAYMLPADKTGDEYFLFENRQQVGWDEYIPGHGMLVWHVDYNQSVWNSNTVNNTASHQYVDIEEADGTQSESSRAGDTFPGTSNVTMIDDDTDANLLAWDGTKSNRRLENITETSDGMITFNFVSTAVEYIAPTIDEPTDVTPVSAVLHWHKVNFATGYSLSVYRKEGNAQISVLLNEPVGDVDSYHLDGLIPSMTYYYTLRSLFATGNSPYSAEHSFTTAAPTFEYLSPVANPADDVTATTFTASWEALEGAQGYELEVYEKVAAEEEETTYGFDDRISGMPEGWTTTATSCYGVSGYYGEAFPSLRLQIDGMYMRTAVKEKPVSEFTFWYRGVGVANATVTMRVLGYNSYGTWETVELVPVGADATIYHNEDLPKEYYAMGVQVVCPDGGSLVVDDVTVVHAVTTRNMLAGYDGVRTHALQMGVEGLSPENKYYYRVRAYDGDLLSLYSNEVAVATTTGVKGLAQEPGVAVRNYSGDVYVTNAGTEAVKASLYDLRGVCLGVYDLHSGTTRIALPTAGIYVLRVGSEVHKVVK